MCDYSGQGSAGLQVPISSAAPGRVVTELWEDGASEALLLIQQ